MVDDQDGLTAEELAEVDAEVADELAKLEAAKEAGLTAKRRDLGEQQVSFGVGRGCPGFRDKFYAVAKIMSEKRGEVLRLIDQARQTLSYTEAYRVSLPRGMTVEMHKTRLIDMAKEDVRAACQLFDPGSEYELGIVVAVCERIRALEQALVSGAAPPTPPAAPSGGEPYNARAEQFAERGTQARSHTQEGLSNHAGRSHILAGASFQAAEPLSAVEALGADE